MADENRPEDEEEGAQNASEEQKILDDLTVLQEQSGNADLDAEQQIGSGTVDLDDPSGNAMVHQGSDQPPPPEITRANLEGAVPIPPDELPPVPFEPNPVNIPPI